MTQHVDLRIKNVVVCSSNSDFLFPLLYDLYTGEPFGMHSVIEVVILIEEEKINSLEGVYCDIFSGGLPKFKDLRISSKLDELKKADIVIIYPDICFIDKEKPKSRKQVLCEQFPLLRKLGTGIEKYLPRDSLVFILGECLSPVRFIVGLYSTTFPHQNIHGVTRHYERQAAAILATRMKVPMREVKGLGVFGEDILEANNGWVEYDVNDLEDDYYEDSLLYYKTDIYQLLKRNEENKANLIEKLTGCKNMGLIDLPDISELHFCEVDDLRKEAFFEEEYNMNDEGFFNDKFSEEAEALLLHNPDHELEFEDLGSEPQDVRVHSFEMGEKQRFKKQRWTEDDLEAWMMERFPDRTKSKPDCRKETKCGYFTMCERFQETWARHWLCNVVTGIHKVPYEWKVDNCMTKLLHQKPPVRDSRWIIGRVNDEKFLKYIVPTKCKEVQNSYTLARSIIDYIAMLQKKSKKRTSALVCSPGIYSVPPGTFSSFPVILNEENIPEIIDGYDISETTYLRIKNQVKSLVKEYELILKLFRAFPPEKKKEEQPENETEECLPEIEEGLFYDIIEDENRSHQNKK